MMKRIITLLVGSTFLGFGAALRVDSADRGLLPTLAAEKGVTMVEINPEETEASGLYAHHLRGPASEMLQTIW
jgi:NAD-dependent SIR2 family protein deacetylase